MSAKKTSATSNTASNQAFNSSSTPTNPDWVTNGVQGLLGNINSLSGTDPSQYTPGASTLQTQAFNTASALPSGDDRLAASNNTLSGVPQVGAQSLLTGLNDYMNPYTDDVVNTTLADFDANAGQTRAAQAAQGAASGAFGGSRWGVQQADTEGQLARARATADATLRDTAFNTGAGLSNDDAGRRQSADIANQQAALSTAQQQASNANSAGALDASNVGLLSGLGDTQHSIDTAQAQSPLTLLALQSGLLGDLPLNLFQGQDTSGTTNGTTNGKSSGTSLGASVGWNAKNGFSLGG